MALGQTNTWFQIGMKTPFSSAFSTPSFNTNQNTKKTTSKNNTLVTYNSRYPWFDEEDYKRLVEIADSTGVTWSEKAQLMDELYQYYYPQVYNKHKLDERQVEINNAVYEHGTALVNGDAQTNANLKLTQLSQKAKEKFGIAYDTPDNDVIAAMTKGIPNGEQLLTDYINNGNPELLYQAWIYDRPTQQWGTKDLINQASSPSDKAWSDKNLLEKWETVTNYTNLLWWGTEELDNAASKFADKWLDRWNTIVEKTTDNLKDKINNMSKEEIEKYRKQYKKELKDKKWTVGQVEWDNLLKQWVNIIKWNISYDYNDEDFLKWLISKKANLGETLTSADDKLIEWDSAWSIVQMYGNIPSSALKTFTATVRGMTNPYDTMKWLYKIIATEEWHQAILDRYGSWDGFSRALNEDPVWVADDILAVAELGTNIARWGVKAYGKMTGNPNIVASASNIPQIWSANDALASKTIWGTYKAMDYIGDYSDSGTIKTINRVLQDQSSLWKLTENTKKDWEALKESWLGQAIQNAKDEFINKMVWVDEKDRKFIRENKELVNNYLDGKKNVDTVLDDVKNKIEQKWIENSEMWKEYEVLREKGQTVNTDALANDMVDTLWKNKITINADWNLEFDKLSKFNPAQQKALQEAWQVIKDAQAAATVDAGTILDLRQKFDDLVNRTDKPTELRNMSSVDKTTEKLIKEMRGTIDARAKAQINWLAELDSKYAPALDEMKEIKKDWFDSDGKIRDNARSKIRNLTKAWNEERLARLEKIAPWITQDLRALDVWLTIEKATKQWVAQYGKWVLGWGWGIGTLWAASAGWPIAWVITWLAALWLWTLTSPKNYVKLVENYPDIVSKLTAGTELLPSDLSRLQALASRLEDWMEE